MTLSNHPPHERWHDWTELDATALGGGRERIGELEPWPPAAPIESCELAERRPLPPASSINRSASFVNGRA